MIRRLDLPVPPISLGTSWTGLSLLGWVLLNSDAATKDAIVEMRDGIGGDRFRAIWSDKADELNLRLEGRVLDARGLQADPRAGILEVN